MERVIEARKTALLIIDMQNDFVEAGAILEVRGIWEGLENFRKFIDDCRTKGVMIIYTQHDYSPEGNPIEAELFPELKERGLRRGTHGFAINSALEPHPEDTIIEKKRYDIFYGTNLEDLLRSRGITDIIISGTNTNICCESTARAAMYRDYHVWFLSDLTFTSDPMKHEYTLKTIATHFGKVVTSEQIMGMLS